MSDEPHDIPQSVSYMLGQINSTLAAQADTLELARKDHEKLEVKIDDLIGRVVMITTNHKKLEVVANDVEELKVFRNFVKGSMYAVSLIAVVIGFIFNLPDRVMKTILAPPNQVETSSNIQ